MCPLWNWMKNVKAFKRKLCLFALATVVVVFVFWSSRMGITVFTGLPTMCPGQPSEETITRLHGTKHLLVSAYADRRVSGKDIRIIGIFNRYSAQKLHCVFCCQGSMDQSPATVLPHSDNFGYPYVTTDVLCQTPAGCKGSHVALVPSRLRATTENLVWLPVRNLKEAEQEEAKLPFNFTVCISVLFGNLNNVLQAAQTLEMYRSAFFTWSFWGLGDYGSLHNDMRAFNSITTGCD